MMRKKSIESKAAIYQYSIRPLQPIQIKCKETLAIARAKITCFSVQRQAKVGVSHLSLFSLFLLHTHIVCVCMLRQPVSGFPFFFSLFFFNLSSSLLLLIFCTDFSVSVLDIFLYSILTEWYTFSVSACMLRAMTFHSASTIRFTYYCSRFYSSILFSFWSVDMLRNTRLC